MIVPPAPESLAAAYAHCDAAVRGADKDRWLASLFAPAERRPDLMALYAFNLEIASVRERVSEPLPGEVRLQWWRDVLVGEARGDVLGHPVAAALTDMVARHGLAVQPLLSLIDARVFDLYDDPMPTVGDLEGYCGETSSAVMQLAALILAEGRDPGTADIAGHAGVAYAVAGLLRSFALHAGRGQVYVPLESLSAQGLSRDDVVSGRDSPGLRVVLGAMRDLACRHLAASERLIGNASATAMAALAPVATVAPRLNRLDGQPTPFQPPPDVPQWRLQWAMWRWTRRFRRVARH